MEKFVKLFTFSHEKKMTEKLIIRADFDESS